MLFLTWLKILFSETGSNSQFLDEDPYPKLSFLHAGPRAGVQTVPVYLAALTWECPLEGMMNRAEKSWKRRELQGICCGACVEHTCWQSRYAFGVEVLWHCSWSSYPACGIIKFINCRPYVIPGINNSGSQKPWNWVSFQVYCSFLIWGTSRSLTLWKSSEYHLKKKL